MKGVVFRAFDRQAWVKDAACHGMTRLFFPERGEPVKPALAVCEVCPVRQPCAELGRNERFGVWGGRAERSRRRLRGAA